MKSTAIKNITSTWKDILHTIFPNICLACQKLPKARDAQFCVECLHQMPYTDHFFIPVNEVMIHLKGRAKIHHGAALLRFREGGIVQQMLHQLKYRHKREVGEVLGDIAGNRFLESSLFILPDVIIPVPIHAKKKLVRRYNQCTVFGEALGKVIGVRCDETILVKHTQTASQTGKSRSERIQNVANSFSINKSQEISGRHILLVDDVVTTGATLEACCMILENHKPKSISILTMAAAES